MIHIVCDSHTEITASLQVHFHRYCYLLFPATASVITTTVNRLLIQHAAMHLCNPVLTKGFQPWMAFFHCRYALKMCNTVMYKQNYSDP